MVTQVYLEITVTGFMQSMSILTPPRNTGKWRPMKSAATTHLS